MADQGALGRDDFNRYVDRHDRVHSDISRDMVPMALYLANNANLERRFTDMERDLADLRAQEVRDAAELDSKKASNDRVKNVEDRTTAIEQRPATMRNIWIGLGGLAVALLGIVVSAYFSAKGS